MKMLVCSTKKTYNAVMIHVSLKTSTVSPLMIVKVTLTVTLDISAALLQRHVRKHAHVMTLEFSVIQILSTVAKVNV